MIKTKEPETPWWNKYRTPENFTDTEDFVNGYNQALEDFDILIGTKPRPGEKLYREAGIVGGNQIHTICKEWRLTFKK